MIVQTAEKQTPESSARNSGCDSCISMSQDDEKFECACDMGFDDAESMFKREVQSVLKAHSEGIWELQRSLIDMKRAIECDHQMDIAIVIFCIALWAVLILNVLIG